METVEEVIKRLKKRIDTHEKAIEAHRNTIQSMFDKNKKLEETIRQKDSFIKELLGDIARLTREPVMSNEAQARLFNDIAMAREILNQRKEEEAQKKKEDALNRIRDTQGDSEVPDDEIPEGEIQIGPFGSEAPPWDNQQDEGAE